MASIRLLILRTARLLPVLGLMLAVGAGAAGEQLTELRVFNKVVLLVKEQYVLFSKVFYYWSAAR